MTKVKVLLSFCCESKIKCPPKINIKLTGLIFWGNIALHCQHRAKTLCWEAILLLKKLVRIDLWNLPVELQCCTIAVSQKSESFANYFLVFRFDVFKLKSNFFYLGWDSQFLTCNLMFWIKLQYGESYLCLPFYKEDSLSVPVLS